MRKHTLASLRAFASTGEPWTHSPWLWLFEVVGGRARPILNLAGGTEIGGGIVMSNWLLPQKPCSAGCPIPGMAADVVDPEGRSVRGRVGELVVRGPWLGQAHRLFNPDGPAESTQSFGPGVFAPGDRAAVDQDGLWYLLGRSDDLLKVAGKRLAPAEVERALTSSPHVAQAAAIGVPDEAHHEAVICFAVLRPNTVPSRALEEELRTLVADRLGRAAAPQTLHWVPDLPRTRAGKLDRRVLRALYLGLDPGDLSTLENPASLAAIRRLGRV